MYYPKDKIIENLDAIPGQFVYKKTLKPYIGKYISTYDDRYFVGKEFNIKNEELILTPANTINSDINISNYKKNTNVKTESSDISLYYNPVLPTEQDYNNGSFYRYFVNRVNSSPKDILEIDFKQYPAIIKDILYIGTKIEWRISKFAIEDVIIYNTEVTKKGNFELPGLINYLKNPIQYYKNIL